MEGEVTHELQYKTYVSHEAVGPQGKTPSILCEAQEGLGGWSTMSGQNVR